MSKNENVRSLGCEILGSVVGKHEGKRIFLHILEILKMNFKSAKLPTLRVNLLIINV